jgi:hypothetical protein
MMPPQEGIAKRLKIGAGFQAISVRQMDFQSGR